MKPERERVLRTKTITITMPDDTAQILEQTSIKLGISETDIINLSIAEYLSSKEAVMRIATNIVGESEPKFDFDPIGFGMWANREDMEDSVTWVRKLREQEWDKYDNENKQMKGETI